MRARLTGHRGVIFAVPYAPNGTQLAVACSSGPIQIWDARTDELLFVLDGHEYGTRCLSYSAEGARLISAGRDGCVKIWDTRTGKLVRILPGYLDIMKEEEIMSVSHAPDGSRIVAGYVSTSPTSTVSPELLIWDARTGERCPGHAQLGQSRVVRHSPDGSRLAVGRWDNAVRIGDAMSGEVFHELTGHTNEILDMDWAPDGRRLATISSDRTTRLWDTRTGECLHLLPGGTGRLAVRWSPDGARLATVTNTGPVRLWDTATWRSIGVLPGRGYVDWSPDGQTLVTGAEEGRQGGSVLWTLLPVISAELHQLAARQARTVGRVAPPSDLPTEWAPWLTGADGFCLGEIRHYQPDEDKYAMGLALAGDDRTLYTGDQRGHVYAWDLQTGDRRWLSAAEHGFVMGLAVSPDGDRLASASYDKTVQIRDRHTGAVMVILSAHDKVISALDYAPDGARLATGSEDHAIRIWDAHTGELLHELRGHEDRVECVRHSPDGTRLASVSTDRTMRIWDSHTGASLQVFRHDTWIHGVCFSPDGAHLACAYNDHQLRVWDAHTGELRRSIVGHLKRINAVTYSPDGALLATASGDGSVRVWDAATGTCLRRFVGVEEQAYDIVWAANGAFLASQHKGVVVRLWDVRPLLPGSVERRARPPAPTRELLRLPAMAAMLQRHRGRALSLAVLRDLLRLLQARVVDGPARTLAGHRGVAAIQALRWSPDALVAVALLLCADVYDPEYAPPDDATPTDLESALTVALVAGEPCPETLDPVTPWSVILATLDELDVPRLVSLLHALGPAACAARPHLLLSLGHLLPAAVPLSAAARRVLASAAPLDRRAGAVAGPLGLEPAGLRPAGPPWALRPWQWALPTDAFAGRLAEHRLTYTDRHGAEPPRLRPTVLVIDDSIEALPGEQLLRTTALLLADALVRAAVPAYLVAASAGHVTPLQHPAQLASLLAPSRRALVDPVRLLARAHELACSLPHAADPPTIVLLTHVYFAADAPPPVLLPPDLRAMCVRYPRHDFTPAWLARCRRHVVLGPADLPRVPAALADLLR